MNLRSTHAAIMPHTILTIGAALSLLAAATATGSCRGGSTAVAGPQPAPAVIPAREQPHESEIYSMTTLIILYDGQVGKEPLLQAIHACGATVVYDYRSFSGMAIRIPDGTDIHDAIPYFKQVEGVLQVSRDHKMQLMRQ